MDTNNPAAVQRKLAEGFRENPYATARAYCLFDNSTAHLTLLCLLRVLGENIQQRLEAGETI